MKTSNWTFAVIGCGRIGLRHIAMIQGSPQSQLVATIDIKASDDLNTPESVAHFSSLSQMKEAGIHPDVVVIATPNGLHAKQALEAIAAGSHVIIEKPMALHKADAEKVLHAALKHGKQVIGVMQNRYSPPSAWLKGMVDEGKLGAIYQVHVDCFWNRDERYYKGGDWHGSKDLDGGTLFTQFSHFIDMLYWLFGDIEPLGVHCSNFNHEGLIDFEDSGMVHFNMLSQKGVGSLNYSTSVWDANLESSMTIIAENGSIKIAGQYMNEVVHCHVKDYEMPALPPSNPPNNYGAYKGSAANHSFVYDNVMEVLSGQGSVTTNALEGLKVVEIIEKIYDLADV
ncbi:MAG: Gfo/Idh/MocA family oxidoreductase [Schleiferiaceae bacterium]|nr:Gfo/Idh/MocA family oxidoreductase [Schleiferiaceae bacterium]